MVGRKRKGSSKTRKKPARLPPPPLRNRSESPVRGAISTRSARERRAPERYVREIGDTPTVRGARRTWPPPPARATADRLSDGESHYSDERSGRVSRERRSPGRYVRSAKVAPTVPAAGRQGTRPPPPAWASADHLSDEEYDTRSTRDRSAPDRYMRDKDDTPTALAAGRTRPPPLPRASADRARILMPADSERGASARDVSSVSRETTPSIRMPYKFEEQQETRVQQRQATNIPTQSRWIVYFSTVPGITKEWTSTLDSLSIDAKATYDDIRYMAAQEFADNVSGPSMDELLSNKWRLSRQQRGSGHGAQSIMMVEVRNDEDLVDVGPNDWMARCLVLRPRNASMPAPRLPPLPPGRRSNVAESAVSKGRSAAEAAQAQEVLNTSARSVGADDRTPNIPALAARVSANAPPEIVKKAQQYADAIEAHFDGMGSEDEIAYWAYSVARGTYSSLDVPPPPIPQESFRKSKYFPPSV